MSDFQHLLDDLDRRLEAGEALVPSGSPEEAKVLGFAVEAVRYEGLRERVRKAIGAARADAAAHEGAAARAETSAAPVHRLASSPVRRLTFVSLRVAAGVALLLCAVGVGKYLMTTPASIYEKMYASYDMGTTRGGEDLNPLEHAYQSKAWSAVDHIFQVKAYPSPEDRFLAGMAYMEQGAYAPAINQFRTVDRMGTDYRDESEYYLALAYLASHQTDSALLLLQKMRTDPEHLFHRKAMTLGGLDLLILRAR